MTASLIVQIAVVVVLFVVAGYAIPALLQVRRTARAVEELVRGVAPSAGGAAAHLDSVLGRVDRALGAVESGSRSVAGAVSGFSAFMHNLRPPAVSDSASAAWLGAVSSFLSGMLQVWSAVTRKARPAAAAKGQTEKGGK